MRVRSTSDVAYTFIAWLPLLAIVVAAGWILCVGVLHLEMDSFGSEFFITNAETTNLPQQLAPSNEQILSDALASGDVDQMSAALDRVEARSAAPAAASAAIS